MRWRIPVNSNLRKHGVRLREVGNSKRHFLFIDPVYPAVAADDDSNALVAWEQKYPPNPTDHDVWGDIVTPSEVPEAGGTAMLDAGVLLLIALSRRRGSRR